MLFTFRGEVGYTVTTFRGGVHGRGGVHDTHF